MATESSGITNPARSAGEPEPTMSDFGIRAAMIRTKTLHCELGCGDMSFCPMEGESDDEALHRHYRAPIHHDHHIHYLGETCFCGVGPFTLWPEDFHREWRRRQPSGSATISG
jgi:hypothetical protein